MNQDTAKIFEFTGSKNGVHLCFIQDLVQTVSMQLYSPAKFSEPSTKEGLNYRFR